jgi:hypothetical protein
MGMCLPMTGYNAQKGSAGFASRGSGRFTHEAI